MSGGYSSGVAALPVPGPVGSSGTTQRGIRQQRTCQHHVRLLLFVNLQIRMKPGCAGGKTVPLNRDAASGKVVEFVALDVEAVLSRTESAVDDLYAALCVMVQGIQPEVFPLDPAGIFRHVGRDGRRKVFDRTQMAAAEVSRVLPGQPVDDRSAQGQEIAPAKLVVLLLHRAQWDIKVVTVDVNVDATIRDRLAGHRVSAGLRIHIWIIG